MVAANWRGGEVDRLVKGQWPGKSKGNPRRERSVWLSIVRDRHVEVVDVGGKSGKVDGREEVEKFSRSCLTS